MKVDAIRIPFFFDSEFKEGQSAELLIRRTKNGIQLYFLGPTGYSAWVAEKELLAAAKLLSEIEPNDY